MTNTAQNTQEALARYADAFNTDRLVQESWHTVQDGRQLACGLGVLGGDVSSPRDCPAAIIPRWLAQMVLWFFDRQKFADAKAWGLEFYKALDRIGGKVHFSVIHDWHVNTVCPLAIDLSKRIDKAASPHVALMEMHKRALAGETISRDEWTVVLKPAYAYADANAYAMKILADGMVAALNRVPA